MTVLADKIRGYFKNKTTLSDRQLDKWVDDIAEIALKETDAYEDVACQYAMLQVENEELKNKFNSLCKNCPGIDALEYKLTQSNGRILDLEEQLKVQNNKTPSTNGAETVQGWSSKWKGTLAKDPQGLPSFGYTVERIEELKEQLKAIPSRDKIIRILKGYEYFMLMDGLTDNECIDINKIADEILGEE